VTGAGALRSCHTGGMSVRPMLIQTRPRHAALHVTAAPTASPAPSPPAQDLWTSASRAAREATRAAIRAASRHGGKQQLQCTAAGTPCATTHLVVKPVLLRAPHELDDLRGQPAQHRSVRWVRLSPAPCTGRARGVAPTSACEFPQSLGEGPSPSAACARVMAPPQQARPHLTPHPSPHPVGGPYPRIPRLQGTSNATSASHAPEQVCWAGSHRSSAVCAAPVCTRSLSKTPRKPRAPPSPGRPGAHQVSHLEDLLAHAAQEAHEEGAQALACGPVVELQHVLGDLAARGLGRGALGGRMGLAAGHRGTWARRHSQAGAQQLVLSVSRRGRAEGCCTPSSPASASRTQAAPA
jgi:hypothetical protein